MSRFRVLIFDLDDTLYPEREFVLSGFRAAGAWLASNLGLDADRASQELLILHDGGARGDTFDRWLREHGYEAVQYRDKMVEAYRSHSPRIEPFPAVPGMLARLHISHPLGLISDGFRDVQRRKLDALGIGDRFDAVVFSDQFGREAWKPSTKPFEIALSMLNAQPGESAYIADNPLKDFLGARKLGMGTIRVCQEGGYYSLREAPAPEYAPDRQVEDIADIERIVLES